MMMRLIDADALKDWIEACTEEKDWLVSQYNADWIWSMLDSAPTIDAVEVVRCKYCKHYRHGKHFTDINFCQRLPYYAEKGGLNTADADFCSYGERRYSDGT